MAKIFKATPVLGVAALTLLVFSPVASFQFVNWDDDKNFLANPEFRGLAFSNLRWMFTTFHLGHYHPLTWMSLGLDYLIWGLDPAGYHITNLLLHAANAVLFYLVALRLLDGSRRSAAFAALFFAVHPLRVESVAWVSERRDVLSGFFLLLSLLAYLRHQIGLSLAAYAAALLSKAIVVSYPLVLLVLDSYPLRRRAFLEKVPYAVLAGAAAITALAFQPTGISGAAEHMVLLPGLRLELSLYALAFYLWKTVVPVGLYPQYADPQIVIGVIVALAITTLTIVVRRYPAVLAVWICYVVSLLPVLSIFRVDPQQYVADHHTYLATLGLALLAAAVLAKRRMPASVLIVGILSVLAYRQTAVWSDSLSLWSRTVDGSPRSALAHNNLGEALAAVNRLDEAVPQFRTAIEIKPKYSQAYYNLGEALQKKGDLPNAVEQFRKALEIEPSLVLAHNDLANCYAGLGRLDEALEHYRLALRYQPDFADAHYNLGNLLQARRQFDQAIAEYQEALRLKPGLADAHNNWGVALDALGRPAEALRHYRMALEIDPQNADAHNNIGISLEAAGKPEEAVMHFREALRFNPSHRDARANLARHLSR